MSTAGTLVDYYARRAAEYERIYEKPERQDDLQHLSGMVKNALAGRRVLEVACGTGWWTELIAASALSVTAIDINEEMLTIARAKLGHASDVKFLRADAYDLSGVSGSFDAALAAFWWSHVPRSRARDFLDKLRRALLPGALVLFLDNAYVAGSSTPIYRTDDEGNTYQLRRLADGSTHEVLKNFPSEAALRSTISGLGDGVRVEFLTYYWTLSCTTRAKEEDSEVRGATIPVLQSR